MPSCPPRSTRGSSVATEYSGMSSCQTASAVASSRRARCRPRQRAGRGRTRCAESAGGRSRPRSDGPGPTGSGSQPDREHHHVALLHGAAVEVHVLGDFSAREDDGVHPQEFLDGLVDDRGVVDDPLAVSRVGGEVLEHVAELPAVVSSPAMASTWQMLRISSSLRAGRPSRTREGGSRSRSRDHVAHCGGLRARRRNRHGSTRGGDELVDMAGSRRLAKISPTRATKIGVSSTGSPRLLMKTRVGKTEANSVMKSHDPRSTNPEMIERQCCSSGRPASRPLRRETGFKMCGT